MQSTETKTTRRSLTIKNKCTHLLNKIKIIKTINVIKSFDICRCNSLMAVSLQ